MKKSPTPKLSLVETELLKSVTELQSSVDAFSVRLDRLERSLKADSGTAQSQKNDIERTLKSLQERLTSLEESSRSFPSLQASLSAWEQQSTRLHATLATHTSTYNAALEAWKKMHVTLLEQQKSYQDLESQVKRLSAALNSLPRSSPSTIRTTKAP